MILPEQITSMIYVTVHPDSLAPAVLSHVDIVAALGEAPAATIAGFCAAVGASIPPLPSMAPGPGKALLWLTQREPPFVLKIVPGQTDRRRHRRKYAEGELPPERSFYFRGPREALNLRAQNLILFMQIADGVDDEPGCITLTRGLLTVVRSAIKDDALAAGLGAIERCACRRPSRQRRASDRKTLYRPGPRPGSLSS
jgi:hypothetical protein